MGKSRAVGLCGDMNGERSADLKTPPGCPLLHAEQVRSPSWVRALLWPPSRPQGRIRPEFTKCPREVIIPTPVSKLYEHISALNIPMKPGMKHIVDKQSNQLCVSKQMVKSCLSKPVSIKKKSVEFSCIPQPSVKASSLEKRALSGVSLIQEISQLPTVFRTEELEAVACSSDISLGYGDYKWHCDDC